MTNTLPLAHKYRFIIALILTAFISMTMMASKLTAAPPTQAASLNSVSSPQHSYGVVPAVFKTHIAASDAKGPVPTLSPDGSITASSVQIDFPRSMVSSTPAPKKEEPVKKPEDVSSAPAPAPAPSADANVKDTSADSPAAAPAKETTPQPATPPKPSTVTATAAPMTGTSPADAQSFARTYLASKGLGDSEFQCLVTLWNHESGWNFQAKNASSGAYGIPQSLPGSKMASVAADWQTNPQTQIIWGLGYISDRYGTPCGAMAIWNTRGWY